ncbi:PspA/IM30 family protein [Candidatus Uhrbacteria bacterium]|nr:PspA/IM30 family protein [Candidatus Uhrbacteria bacterium]
MFKKIRTGVLAQAHKLADALIDLDSVAALKVHIRDLEEALEELQDAAAAEVGNVRTLEQAIVALDARVKELNSNIEFLLSDEDESNDHLATPLQAKLDMLSRELAAKREELTVARQTASQLSEAASNLKAKHASMVERVRSLESLERVAEAKDRAAEAIRSAGAAVAGSDGPSVDDVEARLRRKANVADARFTRAMGEFAGGVEQDVALAQAKAAIERRKAEIAARKAAADQPQPVPAAPGEPAAPAAG